jgi:hypothetical protein
MRGLAVLLFQMVLAQSITPALSRLMAMDMQLIIIHNSKILILIAKNNYIKNHYRTHPHPKNTALNHKNFYEISH